MRDDDAPRPPRQSIPQLSRDTIKAIFTGIEYLDERNALTDAASATDPVAAAHPEAIIAALPADQQPLVRHWRGVITRSDP